MSYAIVGRVRKAQGIRGHVAVELLTGEPDAVFAPGRRVFAGTVDGDLARLPADDAHPDGRQELVVQEAHPYRGGVVVKFDAIPDRTTAERWRQRYLLVPVEELTPPGVDEVFLHDLLGMAVLGEGGERLGEVTSTYELPQGLTLEVRTAAGDVLVPYRHPIVREVDLDARTITVDAGSGLFD